MTRDLERACRLLGPLEARIMRTVWSGRLSDRFSVRDIHRTMPELAYTTVMTTVSRLAAKGLLNVRRGPKGRAAFVYQIRKSPTEYIATSSKDGVEQFVDRYGDAALAAFAARLDRLSPAQRERLRKLGGR
jgi:predicted transcriptional regulator